MSIAQAWSRKSRKTNLSYDEKFHGEENEHLVLFCKDYIKTNSAIDYFIFGHRHLPLDIKIGEKARYINLGEWIKYNSYAVFDGENLEMKEYK